MDLKIDFIRESHLEFNSGFLHTDKKTGLAEYGPYGRTDPALHPSQIGVGFVGTRATTDLGRQWLEECRRPIETDRTRTRTIDVSELDEGDEEIVSLEALAKDLAPDFIGVGPDTPFATSLVTSDRWCSQFTDRDVKEIVGKSSAIERVERATDLISDHVERVATSTPHPNVIIVAVPDDLWKRADAAPLKDGTNLDLRRGLKARAMKWGVPVQLVKESTLRGQGQGLQDKATRAWNFAIALYFKAGGVPWRSHGLDRDTCYVGVSFFRTEDKTGRQILRSGVAQAFDYLGQGIVLRGQPFEWDSRDHGKVPHLPTEEARDLIVRTPRRVQEVQPPTAVAGRRAQVVSVLGRRAPCVQRALRLLRRHRVGQRERPDRPRHAPAEPASSRAHRQLPAAAWDDRAARGGARGHLHPRVHAVLRHVPGGPRPDAVGHPGAPRR